MAKLKSTVITGKTESAALASGTTAQRPGYTVQTFTTVGLTSWTCPADVNSVEVLVVGGGGGTGFDVGGGGGGGGVVYKEAYAVTPGTTYSVSVGAGGASGQTASIKGSNGGSSAFGTNLISNGTFTSGISGWSSYNSTLSWFNNNSLRSTSVAGNPAGVTTTFSTVAGRRYYFKATVTQSGAISNDARIQISGIGLINTTGLSNTTSTTTIYDVFTATSSSHILEILLYNSQAGAVLTIDDVEAYDITNSIVAYGGGGGGAYPGNGVGLEGGSGGGGGDWRGGGASSRGGAGTPGQGFFGGQAANGYWGSAAGGGAAGAGSDGIINTSVPGGAGYLSSITGTPQLYGGGGYGNSDGGTVYPTGYSSSNVLLGTYGFGANGTGSPNNSSYSGNSGIVVLRYCTTGQLTQGALRFNTDLNYTEIYNGVKWEPVSTVNNLRNSCSVATVSGRHIESLNNGYRIHHFLSGEHTFIPRVSGYVEVLVVGGGGAGGSDVGGGGGGGQVIYSKSFRVEAGVTTTVRVGEGGKLPDVFPNHHGRPGYPSVITNGINTIIAMGGGGGVGRSGSGYTPLNWGWTGGGGSYDYANTVGNGGYPGGNSVNRGTGSNGNGGGGGAGGPGQAGTGSKGGNGGPGVMSDITGTPRWYGGGGGGSYYNTTGLDRAGQGGTGGGGRGGTQSPIGGNPWYEHGFNGEVNTGGGGGGGPSSGYLYNAGAGGSGIVIVRYTDMNPNSVSQSFTKVGTFQWQCPPGVYSVEALVVAGGGGGGVCYGGGGGAGGLIYNSSYPVTPGTWYTVAVGAGGTNQVNVSGNGGQGNNSSFASLVAIGGGYGGGNCGNAGGTGGSGGGGSTPSSGTAPGGSATSGQGNAGAASPNGSAEASGMVTLAYGGGGGGAGSAASGRQGGDGVPYAITGTVTWYAGGGSGSGTTRRQGGKGGGGTGGVQLPATIANGVANTGGGGGGSIISGGGVSGLGGSGIVVLRWIPQ